MDLFRHKKILFALLLSGITAECAFSAPVDSVLVKKMNNHVIVYFRFDRSDIDKNYLSNESNFNRLDSLLHSKRILAGMDSLTIEAYASPEGHPLYNQNLALNRAIALKEYMTAVQPHLLSIPIKTISMGENWSGLRDLVENDHKVPQREKVLSILDESIGSQQKEQQIIALDEGKTWRYIEQNMLRYLRGSSCMLFYLDSVKMAKADTPKVVLPPVVETPPAVVPPVEIVQEPGAPLLLSRLVRPIALKTNLLFDAATALNVEMEVPVAKRFSIAGEWIFPWWLWEDKQNCIEVLSGNLEARYWFRPNFAKQDPSLGLHNPLTGWFVGLYGGGGKYDLEWKRKGYQGEFFIATGVSGGYILPLNRNISMEFSLGVGFMRTKYRHYHAEFCDVDNRWHLPKQNSGTYSWFGPTKAKISFIWYPHFKTIKKGGNR